MRVALSASLHSTLPPIDSSISCAYCLNTVSYTHLSLTDTNSKRIFWNTTAGSFVSMTKSGNLCTTISTTSFMANVLLKKLILTFAISFVSIC